MKHFLTVTTLALLLFTGTPTQTYASGIAGIDPVQAAKEWGLDTVAWFIGGLMSGDLTRSTADWVNSGFNSLARSVRVDPDTGEPEVYTYRATGGATFVLDPQAFFQELSTGAAVTFFDQLNSATGPDQVFDTIFPGFRDDLLREVATETQGMTGNFFEDFVSDFQTDEELAERSAYIDDFTQGGWSMFLTTTQNCANNYSCTRLAVLEELNSRIAEETAQAERELREGGGFLSIRECIEDPSLPPGECAGYRNVTPGKLLGEQIVKATNIEFDRANNSDELTEVLVTLLEQAINTLIDQGLSSLSTNLTANYYEEGGIQYQNEQQAREIDDRNASLGEELGDSAGDLEGPNLGIRTGCAETSGGTLCAPSQDIEINAFSNGGGATRVFTVDYTGEGTFESDIEYDFGEYSDSVLVFTNTPDAEGTGLLEDGGVVEISVRVIDLSAIEDFDNFSGVITIGDLSVNIQGVDRRP